MTLKSVPGYFVEVSRYGDVINSITKKPKKIHTCRRYKFVNVTTDYGKHRIIGVHQLVALAFIGPCPPKHEVNHKDLNRGNNYYKNLEYVTSKGNKLHALRHGVKYGGSVTPMVGELCGLSKLTWKQVKKIRSLYKTGNYTVRKLAKIFKVSKSQISNIIRNTVWVIKDK